MRISDWSSDVCSSDLRKAGGGEDSALAHELGSQDKTLDRLVAAVDFLRIAGQPDGLDDGPDLERLAGAFDVEVLDQNHLIAVLEDVAYRIAHLDLAGGGFAGGQFGRRHPLAALLVINIFIIVGHFMLHWDWTADRSRRCVRFSGRKAGTPFTSLRVARRRATARAHNRPHARPSPMFRSEERRVGKECVR